ncbi:MAG: hypothetical protein HRU18_16360 [Pseudoalteromonas sp.]|uniref:hypothetical protein n=1 Tax=Pseudoalteromonas sp. TaxID=53249 RepID=UPI001D484290|nr:hypothetical protein [Pseudoalteromonas sp.]NRA79780.1 hypothetical protein [Pseudoalteromonas sp.]
MESMIPINFMDKAQRTFVDLGDAVKVRAGANARFFNTKGQLIKKQDIVKIQKAGCLSLFTYSNNTIDITVHPLNRNSVFDEAKRLFPKAKIVEIENIKK